MTLFIGDVHGHFGQYEKIIKKHKDTIQIGDMGVGFYRRAYDGDISPWPNPPYDKMVAGNHRFIRGNHDNPHVCETHTQWIPDGTVEGDRMFIGGGLSIDRHLREEGLSYWPSEELSYSEFFDLAGKYADVKPRVMVTHDCPESIANHLFGTTKLDETSRTRQALESMWLSHKPEVWVFGHWHDYRNVEILGTKFICLGELQTVEI